MSKAIKEAVPLEIRHDEGVVLAHGAEVRLPPRQYRVLSALVAAAGKVLTREELLREMVGADAAAEDTQDIRSVDQAVSRIRGLIGAAGPLLRTVSQRGYRWAGK